MSRFKIDENQTFGYPGGTWGHLGLQGSIFDDLWSILGSILESSGHHFGTFLSFFVVCSVLFSRPFFDRFRCPFWEDFA